MRRQPDVNGRSPGMIRRSGMMLERRHKRALCHRDRWRVGEMLRSQPDLREIDPVRDLDLWRHLFDADGLVLIGETATAAAHAPSAEYCWGNVWRDGLPIGTVAYCLSAVDLLRGASRSETMSQHLRQESGKWVSVRRDSWPKQTVF